MTSILICPVCNEALMSHEKYLACTHNHTFDKAKQGYINLLLANQKKSRQPGDNKEMARSRFEFLQKNHYQPIADAIYHVTHKKVLLTTHSEFQIADIGCGVGYYLSALQKSLPLAQVTYWGCDISKDAIQLAAQQNKAITWLVSNANKLPFKSHSLDVLLSVFSPFMISQMQRVLSPDGMILIVTPGDAHLIELRQILFETVFAKPADRNVIEMKHQFLLQASIPIHFQLTLKSKAEIQHLLKMTPFYWRSSREKQATLFELEELTVTIDVMLWVFVNHK